MEKLGQVRCCTHEEPTQHWSNPGSLTALDSGLCLGKGSRGPPEADTGSNHSADAAAQALGLNPLRR